MLHSDDVVGFVPGKGHRLGQTAILAEAAGEFA